MNVWQRFFERSYDNHYYTIIEVVAEQNKKIEYGTIYNLQLKKKRKVNDFS